MEVAEQAAVLRNADLATLLERLEHLNSLKLDAVVPSSKMYVNSDGRLVLLDVEGTDVETVATTTPRFDRQIAKKLGIPPKYASRMRESHPELYAVNVNEWLERDRRRFLIRSYRNGHVEARALLSNTYKMIDNLSVLDNSLRAIEDAGIEIKVLNSDLSESSMYLKLDAPNVTVDAEPIIHQFDTRFTGDHTGYRSGKLDTRVSAGIVIRNGETGGAALSLAPRVTFLVCINGYVFNLDSLREVHLGKRLDAGIIEWSDETRKANADLVSLQTRDAVRAFVNEDYLQGKVNEFVEVGETPLEHPNECVTNVCNEIGLSEERRNAILNHFARTGDTSRFGVVQAITRYAQDEPVPDVANDLEVAAVDILPKLERLDVGKIIERRRRRRDDDTDDV